MDGRSLQFGAVAGIYDLLHPAALAHAIKDGRYNNFLVGDMAAQYARAHGFVFKPLVTEKARQAWLRKVVEEQGKPQP